VSSTARRALQAHEYAGGSWTYSSAWSRLRLVEQRQAFLDDQISVTENGISVYYAAKNSQDPKIKAMAADIGHANLPIGPVGKPTELHLFFNQMVFKYTKFPNAAKEYIRFMMEKEQYEPCSRPRSATSRIRCAPTSPIHLDGGPQAHALPRLHEDHAAEQLRREAGLRVGAMHGRLHRGHMVAEAASGSQTPKDAGRAGAKRAERYYKV